jgi:enoyl-CoA hydratase
VTDRLLVEKASDGAVFTLNRRGARNAIDQELGCADLHRSFALLEERPWVALTSPSSERQREDVLRGINSGALDQIVRLPMPVIGSVEGYALGGARCLPMHATSGSGHRLPARQSRAGARNPRTSAGAA